MFFAAYGTSPNNAPTSRPSWRLLWCSDGSRRSAGAGFQVLVDCAPFLVHKGQESSPEANAFRSVLSHGFKPTAVEGVAIKGKMGHKPARTGYCVSSNYFHPLRSFERAATAILADSWKLLTFPPGCWQLAIGSKMGPYFMSSGNAAFKNCRKKWSVLPATSHCPFAKCWQYCCHAVASPSLASGSKKKNNDQCPMH